MTAKSRVEKLLEESKLQKAIECRCIDMGAGVSSGPIECESCASGPSDLTWLCESWLKMVCALTAIEDGTVHAPLSDYSRQGTAVELRNIARQVLKEVEEKV